MPRLPKPEPVVVDTICSECGLSWDDHGESPTLADCVRLLKARPLVTTYPVYPQQTWPYPWTWTSSPTITHTSNTCTSDATVTNLYVARDDDPPDDAVPAAV